VPETPPPDQKDPTTNRWWVDSSGAARSKAQPASEGIAGSRFYRAGAGFEQEPARDRLTDNNLKILKEAMPVEGDWSYVKLGDATFPARELERIKREVALPAYARGVIVDCGRSVRLLVTGSPIGERVLELTLGEAPSFDCWVHDEWVREQVFKNANVALRAFKRLMHEFLSPEAIMLAAEVAARV
jgi:hypothetical protein